MGSGGHGQKGVSAGVLVAALLLCGFFASALSDRLLKEKEVGLAPITVGDLQAIADHSSSSSAAPCARHPQPDPISTSKRRVPNGPDPIHNRRAGKSRQPPGRT
ncbi:uncharacterized protein LOC116256746 [Nymphaea colorata]|nr:uncharacterized protein LOC116256746 [Nymphaea colorata]